jgi:hypothetical protein
MIQITAIAIGGLLTLAQADDPDSTMARCIDAAATASRPEATVEVYVRHAMLVQACMEIHSYRPDVTRCPECAVLPTSLGTACHGLCRMKRTRSIRKSLNANERMSRYVS